MSSFTAFISNHIVLDKTVFSLWLLGLTVDQTMQYVQHKASINRNTSREVAQSNDAKQDIHEASQEAAAAAAAAAAASAEDTNTLVPTTILRSYLSTQYRNFELLEHFLHRPRHLSRQLLFPLDTETKQYLIETYYSFDERVIREILGKKLNSRSRKELEDISDATHVPIGACRRMFDNLKRIIKKVEDLEGNIVKTIQNEFCLDVELARKYAHIIFITTHRLDTTKKKISHLGFSDLEYCASLFMQHLTTSGSPTDDFDERLSSDCRELKTIILNNRDLLDEWRVTIAKYMSSGGTFDSNTSSMDRSLTLLSPSSAPGSMGVTGPPSASGSLSRTGNSFPASPFTPRTAQPAFGYDKESSTFTSSQLTQQFFKPILRTILSLGSSLSNSKDVRDLITNLVEKIVDVVASIGWGDTELQWFMEGLELSWDKLHHLNPNTRKRFRSTWCRLVVALRGAAVRLLAAAAVNAVGATGIMGSSE